MRMQKHHTLYMQSNTMSEVIYMRGRLRQKQSVWISTVTEENKGIDKILVYSDPQKKNISVSATAGTPEELSAGT